ncbi:hypothetical protein [Pelosinus sp. IPA-1]|uniref:hypothetical protein n=1 Tax=Pelosinus sp. IPA-1 TaxID=3029569 RepID=UPI0024361DC1|nr:hypothetical protein [Pelosinus sp. IPA-1]GMB01084.1 hypothetical protein PIPA1_38830 [Pelosinus sp. IPA-1]
MKFFALFDEDGKRITTHIDDGMPYTEADILQRFPNAIEISEKDQSLYVTGKYYRGEDGKPIEIPPYVPTEDEIKQREIDILDAEYQQQFAELAQALNMATLAENTDLITSTKADYAKLKAEYDAKRGEIDG